MRPGLPAQRQQQQQQRQQQHQQQRQRNDGQSPANFLESHQLTITESWVEVSSHPSSSSVSSIGDEIVTTGLQVGSSSYGPRRRRLHPQSYAHLNLPQQTVTSAQATQPGTSSSQEEYEESESEEDRVLTSSTEYFPAPNAIRTTPLRQVYHAQPIEADSSEEEDDDDENATALGRRPPEPFRPQPNAFSHPPSHLTHRHSTSGPIPSHYHHHNNSRPTLSQRSHTRIDRRTPSFTSPSYQADNDAALRASLTTLLSCAAAARGRSKDGPEKELSEHATAAAAATTAAPGGSQPVGLRLVPESELMAPTRSSPRVGGSSRSPTATTTNSTSSPREIGRAGSADKIKRAATPTLPSGGRSPRATKKKKTSSSSIAADGKGEEALLGGGGSSSSSSTTLLTWVVSAGVVVLVSVVGFGAGYVIGREVGRQEGMAGLSSIGGGSGGGVGAAAGSCGREVMRSSGGGGTLRRFQWGGGGGAGRGVVA
ncbi:hypothetical protein F4778DRAFT_768205 [Xylariomycetidae sp. FL2044]|nr:hypothetical protein F4778DRAFT_768205 [Xylariomycetidae sp. FL2044]